MIRPLNKREQRLKRIKFEIHLIWLMFSTGAVFVEIFFLSNNLFYPVKVYSIKAPIVNRYVTRARGGMKSINAEIQLVNFTKDLSFPNEDEDKVYASNFVVLSLCKGGLGFEIIRDRMLVK